MTMGDACAAFPGVASTAVQLLVRPELAEHWTDGSVLQQFPAAGLAGHMVRGTTTVECYLDRAESMARVNRSVMCTSRVVRSCRQVRYKPTSRTSPPGP